MLLANPINYCFLRMLGHTYCGMFDRNSRKDHRLNMTISFNPLYYHENSCWANNRGHKDDLSLIEQNLLIVGSSFSVFTVLSSISEGRDEEGI